MVDMFRIKILAKDVDLDDVKGETNHPTPYPEEWEGMTTYELHQLTWSRLGKTLFYMEFFHPDVDWGKQKKEIKRYCFWYANDYRHHFAESPENRLWFYKFLFRFDCLVENQC